MVINKEKKPLQIDFSKMVMIDSTITKRYKLKRFVASESQSKSAPKLSLISVLAWKLLYGQNRLVGRVATAFLFGTKSPKLTSYRSFIELSFQRSRPVQQDDSK